MAHPTTSTPPTALVTGASRGIGRAIAERLGRSGWRVALLARSVPVLEQLSREIGNDSFPVECDIGNSDSVHRAVTEIVSSLGNAPDVVVNNAGAFFIESIEDTSPARFETLLRSNLVGPFAITNGLLGAMRARGSGHFVTIGSVADRQIFAGNGAYAAAKHGLRAMHEVLREETRGTGVRATLISPSAVSTDLWNDVRFPGASEGPDRESMLAPEAVVEAVLFAVGQDAGINIDELRLSRA
ncbi:MAG: SDR family NAD(P)-dependent oxidoreductase [Gemmatimonadaceae bacterium]